MLLVLSTTAVIAWYRMNQMQMIDFKVLAEDAVAYMNVHGDASLPEWIRIAEERHRGWRVYIVNQEGQDVLQRELPPRQRSYTSRLFEAGLLDPAQPPSRREDPLLITPIFTGQGGSVYALMADAARSPIDLFPEPDVKLVILTFALVISGLVCWWLARYVSKPVERLQSSARSLAAGNLEARVGEEFSRRQDELGVLARDFDTMADHVRMLIASKETLLRALSHELRSPLARVRVALGLARREGADLPKQLDRIELETERLDTLIGQMLQLTHLRAVEPVLQRTPIDLTGLVSEVVEDARLEASAKDKFVEWVPGGPLALEGDAMLIRSAIENVVRNAVRFTDTGTTVTATIEGSPLYVSIVIEDRGPGVPEAELSRIFEPFYRVAECRDRDSGGTGLGLALTAGVVRLHRGEVHASNRAQGGLRVEIKLPAQMAPSERAPVSFSGADAYA
jgi:two-component system sensor histidine kinase CpxA